MSAALIADWRRHLADERRRSPHTVRAYVAAAERLTAFLEAHSGGDAVDAATLVALDAVDLRAFLAARRAEGLTSASAARELSAVRAFLRFVGGEGHAPPPVRGPRVRRGLPRPVTPDEAVALADDVAESARADWVGLRDSAVLLLLYGAGLRVGEAVGLTGGALPLGDTIRVTGKRGKTRIVPLLPTVRDAITASLDAAPFVATPDAPLFRGARGGPLNAATVRAAVRGARARLGLSERTTPHALRHCFATHLLGAGVDLRSLQELLGHASLSSTQVYTGVDAGHLLDVYRAAHPRAGQSGSRSDGDQVTTR